MKKYFKISSFIISVILIVAVVYETTALYSFVKNIENNADVFSTSRDQNLAGVKYSEKTQNMAKNAAENIFGKGLKFRSSEFSGEEGRIVCYTRNVYMELDSNSMQPVFMVYECKYEDAKKSLYECTKITKKFVLRNKPRSSGIMDDVIYCDYFDKNIAQYHVVFSKGVVFVTLRRDTGSVIFYDASELFQ